MRAGSHARNGCHRLRGPERYANRYAALTRTLRNGTGAPQGNRYARQAPPKGAGRVTVPMLDRAAHQSRERNLTMSKRKRQDENDGVVERVYCKRIKKNGDPCKNAPMKGQAICHKHGGTAPQNLRKAAERISAAAPGAAARIEHLSKYAEKEELQFKANQDLLDRAGIGKQDSLDVNIHVPLWQQDPEGTLVDYNVGDPEPEPESYSPTAREPLPLDPSDTTPPGYGSP